MAIRPSKGKATAAASDDPDVLNAFLDRSACTVDTLYLDEVYFDGGTTSNMCAAGLRGVRELTVELGPLLEHSYYRIARELFDAIEFKVESEEARESWVHSLLTVKQEQRQRIESRGIKSR